ncbi:MAG: hypothetical protein B6D72_09820 [gamma proteobacterium symbiont of Ctena orbiculata]|uniref:Uncharacterized protein n=1 Tax=Candidatus Thiodiazotropha taylori TaxID=2792791 RepID=A0A944QS43_9GAMM|nr:hypothetical protein [Candidatus Thiodiazotropha taylori]PVV05946.1 MAG: hypothetical protein B6D82_19080 [gamma proteobacterium symbiont of Ctena orbiculata]MBT2988458.1 hypothetical protein [Candidatus Thiodiazotropha taylori]MBT2997364.1 hypothetical protein [Candidatus Thiodiazotropha taylori]MBT3000926.1 hypothetical protein [Candidatus Thiodiazotropha taylori]
MNKVSSYLATLTLIVAATAVSSAAMAQGGVQFNLESRGPGAGYNNTRVDRRVGQPKSILKGSAANRGVHNERRFARQLGSEVRSNMRHRGDVARHARQNGQIKATLARQASGSKARFSTSQLSPEVQRDLDRRGNLARQARGKGGTGVAKPRAARVRFDDSRRTRGAGYSAGKPHNKVTKPKGILKNKNTLKRVKKAKKLRTLGKVAAGGVVVAGGTLVAETALGVDIPDAVDAAEWTYGTLKDPRQAPRRFKKLGRDSLRTAHKAGRTLTNPKKIGKNLERGAKKAGKSIKKASCSVGKLFGAKC